MSNRRSTRWTLFLGILSACDATPPSDEPSAPAVPADASPSKGAEVVADPTPTPPPPAEAVSLLRAEKKLPFIAKGSTNLGFKIDALARIYALEGTMEVPEWGATGSDDVAALRDDNLATQWSCSGTGDRRCVVGIHFAEPAMVHAVRVYAGGTTRAEFERSPRPRVVRIHTEAGYADANFIDTRDFQYAILGRPAETRNLAFEVLDLFGPSAPPLRIAELEVYGSRGPRRPELAIDPRATYVGYEGAPWTQRGEDHTAQPSIVHVVNGDEPPRPFLPGSALLGHPSDRFLLLENLQAGTCTRGRGTYFLLDRKSRVLAPLGELGGPGSDLFHRTDGLGLALGFTDTHTTVLNGVMLEDEAYVRRRTPVRPDKRSDDTFKAWSTDPAPLPRGGTPLYDTPGCTVPTEEDLAAVAAAQSQRRAAEPSPEAWRVCPVGAHRLFATTHGPCGQGWELALLDEKNALVAHRKRESARSDLRLAQVAPNRWWVEASDGGDVLQVFDVRSDGIVTLTATGALAARPPASCRTRCDANFPNPHAPKWK